MERRRSMYRGHAIQQQYEMGKLGDGEKGDGKHQGDIREMQFNNGHGKFKMYKGKNGIAQKQTLNRATEGGHRVQG